MDLPPLSTLDPDTRDCFEEKYGSADEYPETSCCPPAADERDCALPSTAGVDLEVGDPYLYEHPNYAYDYVDLGPDGLQRVGDIHALVVQAMALLRDNLDIVRWVTCLVAEYGDITGVDLVDCVEGLITGRDPMFFFYVDFLLKDDDDATTLADEDRIEDATGTAFGYEGRQSFDNSVGVVLAIGKGSWNEQAAAVASGQDAFCAATAAAGFLLHEILHICGYGRGGDHQGDRLPPPCWDESRMADTAFRWAMTQRYPCMVGMQVGPAPTPTGPCRSMAEDSTVFYGGKTTPWQP